METTNFKNAYFAWGCFWCLEWIFRAQKWVNKALVWYIWWTEETATYDQVSTWKTKHREGIKVVYNPEIVSYKDLIEVFWRQIDPTDEWWQFNDRWFQYTTAIYYQTEEEKVIAENSKTELEESWMFDKEIATKIEKFTTFFEAEDYHQEYYNKNPLRYKLYSEWSGREWYKKDVWKDYKFESSEISKKDLKDKLSPLQYKVTQEWWTEPPFDNEYWDNHEEWIYVDIVSWKPLFSSKDKFDSGTGWPSFTKPIDKNSLTEEEDDTQYLLRTEVKTWTCHLWHVFSDWPRDKWWLRYCINSASLKFIPKDKLVEEWYWEYLKLF